VAGKRYTCDDPLLRLFVRLHARPVPPGDADVVNEVRAYARASLPQAPEAAAIPVAAAPERAADSSGIIEID
jgi:hypothetical protein